MMRVLQYSLVPLVVGTFIGCADDRADGRSVAELVSVCIADTLAELDGASCGDPIIGHCGDVHGVCWSAQYAAANPLPAADQEMRSDCSHMVNDLSCDNVYDGEVDVLLSSDPNSYCPQGVQWNELDASTVHKLPLATGWYHVGTFPSVGAGHDAVSVQSQCQVSSDQLIMWDCALVMPASPETRAQVQCSAC